MSRTGNYKDWKSNIKQILKENITKPYEVHIENFLNFLERLYKAWEQSPQEVKEKYAYHIALLKAVSNKLNVIRAKINAYYAYLVYRGYVTVYKLVKDRIIAGCESVYTWLRLYRDLEKYLDSKPQ